MTRVIDPPTKWTWWCRSSLVAHCWAERVIQGVVCDTMTLILAHHAVRASPQTHLVGGILLAAYAVGCVRAYPLYQKLSLGVATSAGLGRATRALEARLVERDILDTDLVVPLAYLALVSVSWRRRRTMAIIKGRRGMPETASGFLLAMDSGPNQPD